MTDMKKRLNREQEIVLSDRKKSGEGGQCNGNCLFSLYDRNIQGFTEKENLLGRFV